MTKARPCPNCPQEHRPCQRQSATLSGAKEQSKAKRTLAVARRNWLPESQRRRGGRRGRPSQRRSRGDSGSRSAAAPLLPIAIRSLATLGAGKTPTEPVARRLIELERLTVALAEVIRKESLGNSLQTPNPAFDGLKPVEVIARGQSDRLWEMVYFLRSGVPF